MGSCITIYIIRTQTVRTTNFMPVGFLFSLGLRLATEVARDLDWDSLSSELSAIDE